jgi:biopolymer transport protein ExbD
MNLKQSMQGRLRGHVRDADVNITAVMNIFLILIPFLLLTAVFVRIAVLELSLPSMSRKGQVSQTPQENVIINMLFIKEAGFELRSTDLNKPIIVTKKNANYDWDQLKMQLAKIKAKHPQSEDIIMFPENTIMYDTIIHVMDRCREVGLPNISISG